MSWLWLTLLLPGGALAQSQAQVLVEVDLGPLDPAPVVELATESARVELPCRDDGQGQDRQQNDDIHTCWGPAPGESLRVTARYSGGMVHTQVELDGPLSLRLGPQGFEELVLSELPLAAQGVAEQSGTQPGTQPRPQPRDGGLPQPTRSQAWWGVAIAALIAGALGWWLRPMAMRLGGLPKGTRWEGGGLVERELSLADALESLSAHILVLAGPAEVSAPVLVAQSLDVQDLLDVLRGLRRSDPYRRITLLVPADAALTGQGEVGLSPMERLLRDAPPGTQVVRLVGCDS